MTDKAHPLPQPEPESSSSEAKVESSSSTVALHAAPKMELKSGNFQVFDMQGRFLGTVKLDAGASVAQVLKANFKNAGIYMVKQGNFMQRVAVK
jgi:LysM repeat protein